MTDEQLELIRQRNEERKQIKNAASGAYAGSILVELDDAASGDCQVVYRQRIPKDKAENLADLYSSNFDKTMEAESDVDILLGEVRRLQGLLNRDALKAEDSGS